MNTRKMFTRGLFLSSILLVNFIVAHAGGSWLGSAWRFRVPVSVAAGSYERLDMPSEVSLNFTQLMSGFGFSGTFIENSLRVVEVDGNGAIIDTAVAFQFDKDSDYNATSKASGQIVIVAKGVTSAGATRTYHVYFHGGQGSFQAAQVTPQVTLTDNIQDAGQSSYRIQANGNTYYYQKQGAGFSSLVDANGNDWLGYDPDTSIPGGDGIWRGLPNAGPAFHPGYTNSISNIVHTGPVKATFRSITDDGKYECYWEIYPRFARMTMTKADSNYWFLYEGTPGGGTDNTTLFMYKSDGTKYFLTEDWNGDIATDEWVYFSDPNEVAGGRSIFVAHAEDDGATDTYWPMYPSSGWPGHMTVFGFGRDRPGDHRLITAVPQHFTMGLMDGTQFAQNSKIIYGTYKPLTVAAGTAEQSVQVPAPVAVSPADQSSGLPSIVQLVWTAVAGASSYHVQASTDPTFATGVLLDDSTIVDTTATMNGLNVGSLYYWHVSAKVSGINSAWTTSWRFSTALGIPVLSDPGNGVTVTTLTPTLRWTSVTGAAAYRLQVSTDPGFLVGMVVDEWNSGQTERLLPQLAEGTWYYWRVAAKTAQVTGSFSSSWNFRTNQASVAPVALQPSNGATGLSTAEIFRWTKVAGAVTYHLQVDPDSTFSGGFFKNDSTIVDTTRTVVGMARGTRYFWHVRAKLSSGYTPFSPIWSFSTAVQLPSQVVLVSPSEGIHLNTDSVSFSWTKSQPSITRYMLELGLDAGFAMSQIDSSITDTTGKAYIPLHDRTYWWRVRAGNTGGWGPFSSVQTFYADNLSGIQRENEIPHELSLAQNYPNPFNPTTRIRFTLPSEKQIRVEVYSVLGERIATLVDDRLSAGVYTVDLDGTHMASGVYYYRLVTPESSITKKMLLVK
jgi:hypothetical protein